MPRKPLGKAGRAVSALATTLGMPEADQLRWGISAGKPRGGALPCGPSTWLDP